jgi:hypothetical protein
MDSWITDPIGDMTLVSILLCDQKISTNTCVARQAAGRPMDRGLVEWTLKVDGYTWEEFASIVKAIKWQKRQASDEIYTFECSECGTAWINDGWCGDDCNGDWPNHYQFDACKRDVIKAKVASQAKLSEGATE